MKLSEFKTTLEQLQTLNFVLPNGTSIPAHFHITEAGLTTKHFIDCGGTVRTEKTITFQLWTADDVHHRLAPQKLSKIIAMAEPLFEGHDLELTVEYQQETVSYYGLSFNGTDFMLTTKQTQCLAQDQCGIPTQKPKIRLADLQANNANACTPGGGCC